MIKVNEYDVIRALVDIPEEEIIKGEIYVVNGMDDEYVTVKYVGTKCNKIFYDGEYELVNDNGTSNLISKLDESSDFNVMAKSKFSISKVITDTMIDKKLSMRKSAEEVSMKHPQIHRVISGDNYNINTLLKILDGLGLEIVIKNKGETIIWECILD